MGRLTTNISDDVRITGFMQESQLQPVGQAFYAPDLDTAKRIGLEVGFDAIRVSKPIYPGSALYRESGNYVKDGVKMKRVSQEKFTRFLFDREAT